MSLTNSPGSVTYLSALRLTEKADQLVDSTTRLAALGAPAAIPADVLAELEDADAFHEGACDGCDIATQALDAAREALAEAAWKFTEAEAEWNRAGVAQDEAARRVWKMGEVAGVKLTASGYRPVTA